MIFSSINFLLFLLIACLVLRSISLLVDGNNRITNSINFSFLERLRKSYKTYLLIIISLIFYGSWQEKYLIHLLLSVAINYYLGNKILLTGNKKYLIVGIILNLLFIGYYKYFNFFGLIFEDVFSISFSKKDIIMPLAISFFTFQQIAYLSDLYTKKITKYYNFSEYLLFVSFFPQLIAGPIVHFREVISYFNSKFLGKFDARDISIGISIFTIGLFKKVIIADNIAVIPNQIFDNSDFVNSYDIIIGALSYSLQIYFDFSGYSDMAIGLGRLFGVKIPVNFYSPYRATSFIDFWRRWHITLGNFLRDYIYIPLGGNRNNLTKQCINIMITMFISGLWHGANYTFVIWGLLHGILICINYCWISLIKTTGAAKLQKTTCYKILSNIVIFSVITLLWIIFRSNNIETLSEILRTLLQFNLDTTTSKYDLIDLLYLLLPLTIVFILPNVAQIFTDELNSDNLPKTHYFIKLQYRPTLTYSLAISFMLLVSLICMNLQKSSEFIYFNF